MTDTQNHPGEEPDAATSTPLQSDLDYKINQLFGGSVGTVCVYQATSPEAIEEHARRADLHHGAKVHF